MNSTVSPLSNEEDILISSLQEAGKAGTDLLRWVAYFNSGYTSERLELAAFLALWLS
ncbi:hypothetical protein TorRG33x02_329940, partial [Trema orientale]